MARNSQGRGHASPKERPPGTSPDSNAVPHPADTLIPTRQMKGVSPHVRLEAAAAGEQLAIRCNHVHKGMNHGRGSQLTAGIGGG